MKKVLFILSFFCSSSLVAQHFIKGLVHDHEGRPFPGVHIAEYRSDATTVSDIEGKFKLNCSRPQQTLILSAIGYKTKMIVADTSNVVNVFLELDTTLPTRTTYRCSQSWYYTSIGISSGFRY